MFTPDERINYAMAFMKYDGKPLSFDFWQQEYVASPKRYICILKSRRVGYSLATGVKGIVKSNDPDRVNYTKQFVSYNESDALEKIRYAEMFHDSMPDKVKKKLIVRNKSCLEFQDIHSKTTSRLISLPCRPPRGKGGDLALDEFGIYNPRLSQTIYTAALSVIARGGCFEVGSTPLGKIGKFYEICTEKEKYKGYQRFFVPWWFCGALCKDIDGAIAQAKEMSTEERVYAFGSRELIGIFENESLEAFQQEHECSFVDEAESYIPLDLIYTCVPGMREEDQEKIDAFKNTDITDFEYAEECYGQEIKVYHDVDEAILNYNPEKHGGPLYLGYDVGKEMDAMSIIVLGKKNGKKRELLRIEEKNKDFEYQENLVIKLMDNLPIRRGVIDRTGVGNPIFEKLYKRYGDRIEGYYFTLESKEPLAMGVKFCFEQREYLLENDKGFHSQIHSIKRKAALGRHFRYDAERSDGLHADSFWSLALATYGMADEKNKENFYHQWAAKKNGGNIITPAEMTPAESVAIYNTMQKESSGTVRRRGRSAAGVLRDIQKNNR